MGDPSQIVAAIVALDPDALVKALNPLSETLLSSTPLVLTGLSVALAFRAGLFNIGGEGQLQLGALASVFVGFSFTGLPWFIHLPLALAAGIVAGALWGFIPGLLKARTGAHEVITTIMLNFVAVQLVNFALRSPLFQQQGRSDPISKVVESSAALSPIIEGLRVHWEIVLAVLAAMFVSWLLFHSTKEYEFRAVGLNPHAARYAGMSIGGSIIVSMMIAGGLAGLAGSVAVLGTTRTLIPGLAGGAGFDGITVALLRVVFEAPGSGRISHPVRGPAGRRDTNAGGHRHAGLSRRRHPGAGDHVRGCARPDPGDLPDSSRGRRWSGRVRKGVGSMTAAATAVAAPLMTASERAALRRQRILGMIYLVAAAVIVISFAAPLSGGTQSTFVLQLGPGGVEVPDLVLPSTPTLYFLALLAAFAGAVQLTRGFGTVQALVLAAVALAFAFRLPDLGCGRGLDEPDRPPADDC